MLHPMKRGALIFLAASTGSGGCEPLRGVVSERDVDSEVDLNCVSGSLERAFGNVERWDYVSDGGTFPKGSEVAQFGYYRSTDAEGWATIEIAPADKRIRAAHSFTGIGAQLPQSVFLPALKAMARARAVLKSDCNLDLSNMKLREVGQDVDALD